MIPAVFRVEHRCEEYPGAFTLDIRPAAKVNATAFVPGQFNMLYAFGAGEVPISMSGASPDHAGYVHTIRSHGLVTQALARLRKGSELGVRGPFGCGWPLHKTAGKTLLIIAGGLGLAPLRPVLYALQGDKAGPADVRLFYGARSPGEMLFRRELEEWAGTFPVALSVDRTDGQMHEREAWRGHVGVITDPLARATFDPARTIAFVCGPEVMMRVCIQSLLRRGLDASGIYLSIERNMKCATGVCGHCQWGPGFVCRDGPVFNYGSVRQWLNIRAL